MGTVSYTVPSKVAQYVIQRHPDISIYTAQLRLDAPADGAVCNTGSVLYPPIQEEEGITAVMGFPEILDFTM